VTIKTTIALEFANLAHRDEFLKRFQALMFIFGNKAPKVKITTSQVTEAEYGQPEDLDLWFIGVRDPAEQATPLELWERALSAMAHRYSPAAVGAQPPTPPNVPVEADESHGETPEGAEGCDGAPGASFDPLPATLRERVLHALAAYGPLTAATLAERLEADAGDVEAELEALHAAGDVDPDDGGRWMLAEAE
jgi:hypothetical protein